MCSSADALLELPPWCNADELITWIDDFVKWRLMAAYYGTGFADQLGLLWADNVAGFRQDRTDRETFGHAHVSWSTNVYLDPLLMGCIISYCIDPKHRFWPHIVDTTDAQRSVFHDSRDLGTTGEFLAGLTGWLFESLDRTGAIKDWPTTRTSLASVALICSSEGDQPRWMMQWNAKWKVMNFIAGHKGHGDPNDLGCMLRELHEELFGELPSNDLANMYAAVANADSYDNSVSAWQDPFITSVTPSTTPPHDLRYVGYSESAAQWSQYEFKIYDVQLNENGWKNLFLPNPYLTPDVSVKPDVPSVLVSADDIRRGWTAMGHPVSPTAQRIMRLP